MSKKCVFYKNQVLFLQTDSQVHFFRGQNMIKCVLRGISAKNGTTNTEFFESNLMW